MSLKHTNGYAVIDQSSVRKMPPPVFPNTNYSEPIDLNTNEHVTNFEICVSAPARTDTELPSEVSLHYSVQGCDTLDFSGNIVTLASAYQTGNGAGALSLDFRCRPPVIFPRYIRLASEVDPDAAPLASKRVQLDIRS
ncbi:MAG: hypothetical protein HN420_09975 [Rhodospirillaceae bacterium]|jgi:hypothetical protein|nr:hypothetical protein [Rhodospirillaceae bacterium]